MVLGIPGSGTTAVILVGLLVHGLRPGPDLFTQQVDKVYAIFGAMLVANIMFLVLGLYAAKLFARVSLVPTAILWPIVFSLSVIGAYALNQSLQDVWIVMIFGVLGYFMRRFGFAVAPVAIGLILGEMVETNLQNSLKMFDGQWWMIASATAGSVLPDSGVFRFMRAGSVWMDFQTHELSALGRLSRDLQSMICARKWSLASSPNLKIS
jgi:putative tricarboxylic transport membrane protein